MLTLNDFAEGSKDTLNDFAEGSKDTLNDFAEGSKDICPEIILFSGVPKLDVDFVTNLVKEQTD